MKTLTKLALTATFGVATALTFSCHDGGSDDGETIDSSSSHGSNVVFGSFTDKRNYQTYKTVKIGIQTWMAENLNYNASGECYNNAPDCEKYGRLYKWEEAMQVCPDGWHLSTKAEWIALISAVGEDAGKKLKASSDWRDGAGIDSYGFGALPGGALNNEFKGLNIEGSWWTSTEYNEERSYVKWMDARNEVYESTTTDWGLKTNSFSVRCVKNYSSSDYTNGNIEYGSVADNSGKTYNTVKIGTQVWMAENLNYDVPNNETDICYDNDNNNCPLYGKMYNWATAMALPSKCNSILSTNDDDCVVKTPHQGICPSGWHIPSNVDWDKLMREVDGNTDTSSPYESETASKYLKAKEGWHDCGPSNSGKTYLCEDTYGFSILPGGSGDSYNNFHNVIYWGYWWNSSEKSDEHAYHRCVDNDKDINFFHDDELYHSGKFGLFSVRCVKD